MAFASQNTTLLSLKLHVLLSNLLIWELISFRKFKKNGGVSIFVHQNLQFTPIDFDEFCTDKEIEICALKLHNVSTNICILTVYRSPTGNFLHFLNNLFLCEYAEIHKILYYVGI
jgi:hypothetical protein